MKSLYRTQDNRIIVKETPQLRVYVTDGKIFVTDGIPTEEAVEAWITVNGTHIPLGEHGEQVGGPDISPYTRTEKNKHLVALKEGEKIPESVEKAIGRKVPKNWTNVMISKDPTKDMQVMGKDSKGRVHMLYTKEHDERQAALKWERTDKLLENPKALDNAIEKLAKTDKESSDCLKLIRLTGLRPGSTTDTKAEKPAYGATTLQGRHVVQEGDKVFLRFVGKEGVDQNHEIRDRSMKATLLERKQNAGDNGDLFKTTDKKLLRCLPKGIITKDLRTLKANEVARSELAKLPKATNAKEYSKIRSEVGEKVSRVLGNKPEMALSKYINPKRFQEHSPEQHEAWENKKAAKSAKGAKK